MCWNTNLFLTNRSSMVDLHSNPGWCCFLDCLARWNSPGKTLVLVNFGLFGQNILHLEKVVRTFLCDVFYLLIRQHSQVSGMCNSSQSEDHGAFQVSSWKIRSHFSLRNLSLNLAKNCKLCDFSLTYGANCTFLITIQCQYLRRQLRISEAIFHRIDPLCAVWQFLFFISWHIYIRYSR